MQRLLVFLLVFGHVTNGLEARTWETSGVVELHVDKHHVQASDKNSGDVGQPFETIQGCVNALKDQPTSEQRCVVHKGVYEETVSVAGKIGASNGTIKITAAKGENATLIGAARISGWTKWRTLENKNIIWVSDALDATAWPDGTWQLWMGAPSQDGNTPLAQRRYEMMTPARFPNAKFSDRSVFNVKHWGKIDHASTHACIAKDWVNKDCPQNGKGTIKDHGEGVQDLTKAREYGESSGSLIDAIDSIAVANIGSWKTYQLRVKAHGRGNKEMTYDADFKVIKHHLNGYFLEGKKEFLDGQEEWFYDKSERRVYLITDDNNDPSTREVLGKRNTYCMDIQSAAHLTIEGFSFFGCTLSSNPIHSGEEVSHLTVSSNQFFFPSVSKRAIDLIELAKPTAIYTAAAVEKDKNDTLQKPFTLFNNIFFGSEGPALEYRGSDVTMDNNLFFNNDWTGIEASFRKVDSSTIVGVATGQINFRRNTLLYNGASAGFRVTGSAPLVERNLLVGQCFGAIQNDGSMIQVGAKSQSGSKLRENWGFSSAKGTVRFDDAAQCLTGKNCIGFDGTMERNVAWRTGGILVKGNNHTILNNLAIDSALRVYDKFKANDCPVRCMNNFTTARQNVANDLKIQRSQEKLQGVPDGNAGISVSELRLQMRDLDNWDFRPRKNSILDTTKAGPYLSSGPSYWIPGRQERVATHPIPPNNGEDVPADADLIFRPALGATSHLIYFGCDEALVRCADKTVKRVFKGELTGDANVLTPKDNATDALELQFECPRFFWRVDAVRADGGVVKGSVWNFRVKTPGATEVKTDVLAIDDAVAAIGWPAGHKKDWVINEANFQAMVPKLFGDGQVMVGGRWGADMEYFVKFKVEQKAGRRLRSASVLLPKYEKTLVEEMRSNVYDEDDDLSAWEVPGAWDSTTLTSTKFGAGLDKGTFLGERKKVGQVGTPEFDVFDVVTDGSGNAKDGEFSFRFKATGSRRRAPANIPKYKIEWTSVYAARGNAAAAPTLRLVWELPAAPTIDAPAGAGKVTLNHASLSVPSSFEKFELEVQRWDAHHAWPKAPWVSVNLNDAIPLPAGELTTVRARTVAGGNKGLWTMPPKMLNADSDKKDVTCLCPSPSTLCPSASTDAKAAFAKAKDDYAAAAEAAKAAKQAASKALSKLKQAKSNATKAGTALTTALDKKTTAEQAANDATQTKVAKEADRTTAKNAHDTAETAKSGKKAVLDDATKAKTAAQQKMEDENAKGGKKTAAAKAAKEAWKEAKQKWSKAKQAYAKANGAFKKAKNAFVKAKNAFDKAKKAEQGAIAAAEAAANVAVDAATQAQVAADLLTAANKTSLDANKEAKAKEDAKDAAKVVMDAAKPKKNAASAATSAALGEDSHSLMLTADGDEDEEDEEEEEDEEDEGDEEDEEDKEEKKAAGTHQVFAAVEADGTVVNAMAGVRRHSSLP